MSDSRPSLILLKHDATGEGRGVREGDGHEHIKVSFRRGERGSGQAVPLFKAGTRMPRVRYMTGKDRDVSHSSSHVLLQLLQVDSRTQSTGTGPGEAVASTGAGEEVASTGAGEAVALAEARADVDDADGDGDSVMFAAVTVPVEDGELVAEGGRTDAEGLGVEEAVAPVDHVEEELGVGEGEEVLEGLGDAEGVGEGLGTAWQAAADTL
jgi:hypothetical protein